MFITAVCLFELFLFIITLTKRFTFLKISQVLSFKQNARWRRVTLVISWTTLYPFLTPPNPPLPSRIAHIEMSPGDKSLVVTQRGVASSNEERRCVTSLKPAATYRRGYLETGDKFVESFLVRFRELREVKKVKLSEINWSCSVKCLDPGSATTSTLVAGQRFAAFPSPLRT